MEQASLFHQTYISENARQQKVIKWGGTHRNVAWKLQNRFLMLFNVFNVFMLNFLVDSFKPIKSTRKQLVIAIFWHVPKVNNNLTFDFLFSIYKSMIHYPSLNSLKQKRMNNSIITTNTKSEFYTKFLSQKNTNA